MNSFIHAEHDAPRSRFSKFFRLEAYERKTATTFYPTLGAGPTTTDDENKDEFEAFYQGLEVSYVGEYGVEADMRAQLSSSTSSTSSTNSWSSGSSEWGTEGSEPEKCLGHIGNGAMYPSTWTYAPPQIFNVKSSMSAIPSDPRKAFYEKDNISVHHALLSSGQFMPEAYPTESNYYDIFAEMSQDV